MKIAIVCDVVYPYVVGGAQKRYWEIVTRLAKRGHEITLFGMKYWEGKDIIFKEGVRLWGVCHPQTLYKNGQRSTYEAISFAWRVLPQLAREKYDIIDCGEFPYFPCFSAKICSLIKRTPLVLSWYEVWGDYWYEYLGKKGILGKWVEKAAVRLPDGIIAISQKVNEALPTIGANSSRIKIIPDGVDCAKIQSVLPMTNISYDVIYAGRLAGHKNVDVLLSAISSIKKSTPSIKCGIIGDGPEKDSLLKQKHELGLGDSVIFHGFLEQDEDVIAYMKASKVYVLPSTREGAGLVTLEANASGLPVITINHKNNAAAEVVINGNNGFLCELTTEALAMTILQALSKSDKMKNQCIEFAKGYDWDKITGMTESLYRDIVNKH